ncbi:hypothetical protein E2F47_01750 [Mycobacterium eburneum]|nr:hypothetical protein [Mycobacterium eburneum]TDH57520.1 hypothetical protein E2F47_01750 [Mycobacterium eburneum]
MSDLTLPDARAERDALAGRVDVLDKVGVLRTLPDDMHVTTDMVAEFYQVPIETIRTTVNRNREEFDADGVHVMSRAEFDERFNLKLSSRASSFMLYPRRAVLRVGMLLRDSPVARDVRDYLLNVEQASRGVELDLTDPDVALDKIIELAKFAKTERAGRIAAEAQLEAERPLVERAKTHASGEGEKTRQQFFREIKQWAQDTHGVMVKQADVMAFLSTRKLRLFVGGNRSDTGNATAWAIEKGYARNPEGTADNGHNFVRPVLTPLGQAYAWDRCVRYIDANGTLALPREIGVA